MRLTAIQRDTIRNAILNEAGDNVRILVFGSRLDDTARGGDVDLMVEFTQPVERPALMSARSNPQPRRTIRRAAVHA